MYSQVINTEDGHLELRLFGQNFRNRKTIEQIFVLFQILYFRDHTLSIKKGARRVFAGVMKYFRHILMGHEIFLKIFDGPQKIFLCAFFLFFFKFLIKSCGGLSTKSSN